jgi:hypothetical protein
MATFIDRAGRQDSDGFLTAASLRQTLGDFGRSLNQESVKVGIARTVAWPLSSARERDLPSPSRFGTILALGTWLSVVSRQNRPNKPLNRSRRFGRFTRFTRWKSTACRQVAQRLSMAAMRLPYRPEPTSPRAIRVSGMLAFLPESVPETRHHGYD